MYIIDNFGIVTNESYNYLKGKLPSKSLENKTTLFLNVSAANNKPNKYVSNNTNTFVGDITLSLDGNTGLVNNSLFGFNGYLYKVTHNKYINSQIYYSLKTKVNQRIIKMNETGTTIKHSPKSKIHIKHISQNKIDEHSFFKLNILMKQITIKIEKIKSKLIKLLVR